MADNRGGGRIWHPLEYAHVFLWLIKDLCWARGRITAGSVMVIPTILVAVVITWVQRKEMLTLIHNLAISLWISSNSLWMLAEFFEMEQNLKQVSSFGFAAGIILLAGGYLRLLTKK